MSVGLVLLGASVASAQIVSVRVIDSTATARGGLAAVNNLRGDTLPLFGVVSWGPEAKVPGRGDSLITWSAEPAGIVEFAGFRSWGKAQGSVLQTLGKNGRSLIDSLNWAKIDSVFSDSVVFIKPLGVANGTVRIRGTSMATKIPSADFNVTVTGQPEPPRSIAGFGGLYFRPDSVYGVEASMVDTTTWKRTRNSDTGQVHITWSEPTNKPPTVTIVGYQVAVSGAGYGYGNASNKAKIDAYVDSVSFGKKSGLEWGKYGVVAGGAAARSVVLNDLLPGTDTIVHIRPVYSAPSSGPAYTGAVGSVRVKVPVKRADISPYIAYNPVKRTYNGQAQDIGEATVVNTGVDYTNGGKDPWITLYTFMGLSLDSGDATKGMLYKSDTASFAKVNWKPVDAQECSTTVWIYNSLYVGTKTVKYTIDPAPLSNDFITEVDLPADGYTYDGTEHKPTFVVKDPGLGGKFLLIDQAWRGGYEGPITTKAKRDSAYVDNINAGSQTAKISIVGVKNYAGSAQYTFSIGKRPIAIDTSRSSFRPKTYDGTAEYAPESLTVKFTYTRGPGVLGGNGLITLPVVDDTTAFIRDSAYVVRSANLDGADVFTANNYLNAVVELVEDGTLSKNYTLTSSAFRKGIKVTQKAPDSSDLSFNIPKDHYFNGEARGAGTVEWKVAGNDDLNKITVLYTIGSRVTDTVPSAAGTYAVTARVTGTNTSNYIATTTPIPLGNYVIMAPAKPALVDQTMFGKTHEVRGGRDITLYVGATSPNNGVLSYQWYKDNVALAGETDSFYIPNTSKEIPVNTSNQYFVWVTNTVDGVQFPDSIKSNVATVRVIEPAIDIAGAVIGVTGTPFPFVYTGANVNPRITVTHFNNGRNNTLTLNTDYDLAISDPINAGDALITITGKNKYEGTEYASFAIGKKKLERNDFSIRASVTYNGDPQPITIIPASPKTGIGSAVVQYGELALGSVPNDVGAWATRARFEEGDNFLGSDTVWFDLGTYTIAQKTAIATDFSINGVPFVSAAASIPTGHVFSGQPQGIGSVTITKGTEHGTLTVKYNGKDTIPAAAGTYAVTVDVAGGTNFRKNTVALGSYTITSVEAVVAAAKSLVTATSYGAPKQADVNSNEAAKEYAEGVIEKLDLNGVTATVRGVTFTPPVAGTTERPNGTAGRYEFKVVLNRGAVTDSTGLISFNIAATPVSIASNDRVIPGSKGEQAIVAPVIKLVGEFTVGPNPVAKAAGKVGFFWQGKSVTKGTLFVFDASGNLVKKIGTADVKGLGTDRREIGSWNLADAKGRPIAEGTYLVKGVLTVGGEKVKVSSILGVR
jgi:hypothetical protein